MHLLLEIVAAAALIWLLSLVACVAIVRRHAEPSSITLGGARRPRGTRRGAVHHDTGNAMALAGSGEAAPVSTGRSA